MRNPRDAGVWLEKWLVLRLAFDVLAKGTVVLIVFVLDAMTSSDGICSWEL